jgi:hypothetical protein
MSVDFDNLFDARRDQEGRGDAFLDAQENAMRGGNLDK